MAKRTVAVALLLFALVGLVTFAVKVTRAASPEVVSGPPVTPGPKPPAKPNATVAYYLHAKVRCITCNTMGAYTEEAMKTGFAAELADGRLEYRLENFEAPGNEFFEKDYFILAASAILIEFRDGKPARWKNLEDTWGQARNGKPYFVKYVQDETRAFLDGKGGEPIAISGASPAPPEKVDAVPEDQGWRAWALAAAMAIGLGLLTAISPCPLATNVAAISFLGKRVSEPRKVLLAGVLYSLGRTVAYVALGMILVFGLLTTPGLKNFLNTYINGLLGPILVIVGVFLLELLELTFGGLVSADKLQAHAGKGGVWGAALLGLLFALAFCPTSIALFFGTLIPLSVKWQSGVLLPSLYGLATGVPVVLFAVLIALASQAVGKWFNALSRIEFWLRRTAGVLFILVGFYYSLIYVFGVALFSQS